MSDRFIALFIYIQVILYSTHISIYSASTLHLMRFIGFRYKSEREESQIRMIFSSSSMLIDRSSIIFHCISDTNNTEILTINVHLLTVDYQVNIISLHNITNKSVSIGHRYRLNSTRSKGYPKFVRYL